MWIDRKKRLPPKNVWVLIATTDGVRIVARRMVGRGKVPIWRASGTYIRDERVQWWQELEELPEQP